MLKIPFYTFDNYQDVIAKSYEDNKTMDWIELKDILSVLSDEFVAKYASVNSCRLWDYVNTCSAELSNQTVSLWGDRFVSLEDFIVLVKLAMPTLWTCSYFTWDVWNWSHHGIDIMLPKGTPLTSFVDGTVDRIKSWDGVKKNEWNCVVIKWKINDTDTQDIFIGYEHMDSISVTNWQTIKKWDVIWTCGSTWNSTQFHLHLQVDAATSPFHPYRSGELATIREHTLDPITVLRKIYTTKNVEVSASTPTTTSTPTVDTSTTTTTAAVTTTETSTTVSSDTSPKPADDDLLWDIVSELSSATDDEKKTSLTSSDTTPTTTTDTVIFTDMPNEEEYQKAIMYLYDNGIVKWYQWQVFPDNLLTRFEFTLIMYRIINKMNLTGRLTIQNIGEKKFVDVDYNDSEFSKSVSFLYKYGIMKWDWDKFSPDKQLTGEQTIAVLGRIFYSLEDANTWNWYDTYMEKFKNMQLIDWNWDYIRKSIPRKEVFRLILIYYHATLFK